MSKLLEKLDKLAEGRAQPLGFSAALARAKISPMVIIAKVALADVAVVDSALKGGADALLLPVNKLGKDKKALSDIVSAVVGIPWGVSLEAVNKKDTEQLTKLGCDYVIFDADKTPAATLGVEQIGKVLHLDTSLSDNLIRTIGRLSVDAVLLSLDADSEPSLTVRQLMDYERLVSGVGKHALVALPTGFSVADVESLWGIGVRGVVLDMYGDRPEEKLSQLKEAIQKLPATPKKARKKSMAILPVVSDWEEAAPPEEEEEEEEE
ncbi:hypothetical protein ACFLTS_03300 [Chloroflexota bacterium]